MRKNIFKKLALLSALVMTSVCVSGYTPVSGDGHPDEWEIDNNQFVYDYADAFTDSEELELQELCEEVGKELELDLVVVTTNEAGNKTSEQYADDFYDQGRYGYEEEYGSGVLFLLDFDNSNMWISTSDLAMLYIDNDIDVDTILDAIEAETDKKDYYASAEAFVGAVSDIVETNKNDSEFEELADRWDQGGYEEYDEFEDVYSSQIMEAHEDTVFTALKNPLLCLGIGAAFALIVVLFMCFSSSTKMTAGSKTYMKSGSFNILRRFDKFTHTTTTTRQVNSSSGGGGSSSGHRSSGGRSHGGGGRRL